MSAASISFGLVSKLWVCRILPKSLEHIRKKKMKERSLIAPKGMDSEMSIGIIPRPAAIPRFFPVHFFREYILCIRTNLLLRSINNALNKCGQSCLSIQGKVVVFFLGHSKVLLFLTLSSRT